MACGNDQDTIADSTYCRIHCFHMYMERIAIIYVQVQRDTSFSFGLCVTTRDGFDVDNALFTARNVSIRDTDPSHAVRRCNVHAICCGMGVTRIYKRGRHIV